MELVIFSSLVLAKADGHQDALLDGQQFPSQTDTHSFVSKLFTLSLNRVISTAGEDLETVFTNGNIIRRVELPSCARVGAREKRSVDGVNAKVEGGHFCSVTGRQVPITDISTQAIAYPHDVSPLLSSLVDCLDGTNLERYGTITIYQDVFARTSEAYRSLPVEFKRLVNHFPQATIFTLLDVSNLTEQEQSDWLEHRKVQAMDRLLKLHTVEGRPTVVYGTRGTVADEDSYDDVDATSTSPIALLRAQKAIGPTIEALGRGVTLCEVWCLSGDVSIVGQIESITGWWSEPVSMNSTSCIDDPA
ncbi:hypothetical protein HDU93_008621 [Gonapodya sp. JEL0774]|nr:hypothetical protein HDU93_008621 [Gonapodya sp. JEL0774]